MAMMDAVRYASTVTQSVIVGLSLGKDSVCLLDLCCRNFRRVYPFFMYFVKGLEFQENYIRYLEKRYGVSVLKIPHWMLGTCYLAGLYRNQNFITDQCPNITIKDVELYLEDYFGCGWFAYGQMMCESIERNAMIKSVGQVDEVNRRIYPLAEWSPKKVRAYLSMRKIPLSPEYRYAKRSIGDLRPENLEIMKAHFPGDYETVKRIFPYIEAQEMRKLYEKNRQEREKAERAEEKQISDLLRAESSEKDAERSGL